MGTDASLSEMIAPGALVMLSPIFTGVVFGTKCVTGLLAGAIASGVQMAISSSNTGGAWDNAKKFISGGKLDSMIAEAEPECVINGRVASKKSQIFKAAVTGDTVGDPLKDTSGPALNILMKLMAIISVVFSPLFLAINQGGGLIASVALGSVSAVTTSLVELPATPVALDAQAGPVAVAFVFVAGAFVGMGGSLLANRIANPPQTRKVNKKSLAEPLLVCKADGTSGTALSETLRRGGC